MPRKNTAEYREYMKDYMKRKRLGLTGINMGLTKKAAANSSVTADLASNLERETRFELATFCLGSRHSTAELLPRLTPRFYDKTDRKTSGMSCNR